MQRAIKVCFAILISLNSFSNYRDSLWSIWQNVSLHDTIRVEAMQYYAWSYLFTKPDSAIILAHKELDFSRQKDLLKWQAKSYNTIGLGYMYKAVFDSSYKYLHLALDNRVLLGDKNDIARSYGNLGILHQYMSNYPVAIEYFMKSLDIKEKMKDTLGVANTYNNIGTLYSKIEDYENENAYHLKSLELYSAINNTQGIARVSFNLGVVQSNLKNYTSALQYYQTSEKLYKELNDINGIANVLSGLGSLYATPGFCEQEKFIECPHPKAIQYLLEANNLFISSNYLSGFVTTQLHLASYYKSKKNYKQAIIEAQKALYVAKENQFINEIIKAYYILHSIYQLMGDYKNALDAYIAMDNLSDSLFSVQNKNEILRNEMKLSFENKALADSLKAAEEKKLLDAQLLLQEEQIAREKTQRTALYGGVLVLICFLFITYRRYKISNRRKEIIQEQKHLIETKHREITDSINYAERIQRSFLATESLLNENLQEYFVYFNPKEAVSGDFYWASALPNGSFALCCADSTGHGVPGAIMSILNISSLERAIEVENQPHLILNRTREFIIERLKKDGSTEGGKDGMDCSLLVFDSKKTQLTFASAHNPIFVTRKGELIEFKGDKMPVGKHQRDQETFTLQTFDLQKGDIIYTLTDGFPDQFGGEKGKKYRIKNLKEFILKIADLPLDKQKFVLDEEFIRWKGEDEQVDDVCIIGVKV